MKVKTNNTIRANHKHLVLIDGSSVLSTNFYGTLPREWHTNQRDIARNKMMKTSTGVFTNGVFGMMKSIMSMIQNQNPTHIAIAWDVNRNTFRREKFPAYKANRGETAEELKSQFVVAQEIFDALGIQQFAFERYEADDIIGTLSRKFEEESFVSIITKDQDALQLITDKTRVWLNTSTTNRKIFEFYGEGFDRSRYNVPVNHFEFTPTTFPYFYEGLSPAQMVDLKGLEGDPSDNIPGVKGCGAKSIYPLLREFKTIEGLYEYIESNDAKTIRELFKSIGIKRSPLNSLIKESTIDELSGKEAAFISRELAIIETNMSQLDDLLLSELEVNINVQEGRNAFLKYEFSSLLRELVQY